MNFVSQKTNIHLSNNNVHPLNLLTRQKGLFNLIKGEIMKTKGKKKNIYLSYISGRINAKIILPHFTLIIYKSLYTMMKPHLPNQNKLVQTFNTVLQLATKK